MPKKRVLPRVTDQSLAALKALDGRSFATLTRSEVAFLGGFRPGRRRRGRPWISVSFAAQGLDPWAWLHAPTRKQADDLLRQAEAVVRVTVYDDYGHVEFPRDW
jgi:hypothetical protein